MFAIKFLWKFFGTICLTILPHGGRKLYFFEKQLMQRFEMKEKKYFVLFFSTFLHAIKKENGLVNLFVKYVCLQVSGKGLHQNLGVLLVSLVLFENCLQSLCVFLEFVQVFSRDPLKEISRHETFQFLRWIAARFFFKNGFVKTMHFVEKLPF